MTDTITVKLSKLKISPNNIRTRIDEKRDAEMKASIAAHGVIQNLLVAKSRSRGKFDVIGGGRRLRQLQALVAEGEINKDFAVDCKLITGDASHQAEISTVENFHRQNMSPAEECRAFTHFVNEDGDSSAVAKRFGVTRRFVEGRLRLANLAEPIFEALDQGDITLDVAQAYGSTSDQSAQLRVFEEYGANASTTFLRNQLRTGAVRGDSALARLIGKAVYLEAGGTVEEDLFTEDAFETYTNAELLRDLAASRMEARAAKLQGELACAWVKPVAQSNSFQAAGEMQLERIHVPYDEHSEADEAKMNELAEKMEELSAEHENAHDEVAQTAISDQYASVSADYDAINRRRVTVSAALGAKLGRILLLSPDGSMFLDETLFSAEPVKTTLGENGELIEAEVDSDCGTENDGAPRSPAGDEALPPTDASTDFSPDGSKMSRALFEELAVQRRDVIAANLLDDPRLALDYAMFSLISDRAYSSTIGRRSPDNPRAAPEQDAPAILVMAKAGERLPMAWHDGFDEAKSFAAFRELDDEVKASLLAYSVASSLNPQRQTFGLYEAHDLLAAAMEIDFANHWRPTAANYFGRIKRATVLAILREIGGETFAARYADLKKGELAEAAEKIFAGTAIIDPDIKERALRWMPPIMSRGSSDPAALGNVGFKAPPSDEPSSECTREAESETTGA